MSFLPLSILPDFALVTDGLSPVICGFQPDLPADAPPHTPFPPYRYLYCEIALKREQQVLADMAIPAGEATFHLYNPLLNGILIRPGSEVIEPLGYAWMVMSGIEQTFSSRFKLVCSLPDAGTTRYHPWTTFSEFLANLSLYPPVSSNEEWFEGQ